MQLYRYQEKDNPYNNFQISLMFPVIKRVYFFDDFSQSYYKGVNISFDTTFDFRHTHDHWMFMFAILGLGISASRQTDY
jgi:hypothetical protein